MSLRSFCTAWLVVLALGGCSLPAPYETYPPDTPPAAPPRAANALTVTGATTTSPENELGFTDQELQAQSKPQQAPPAASATSPQQVAICYSRLWNSAAAVRSAAVQACGVKRTPQIVNQDTDLSACPLMTPTHAVFTCNASP